MIESQAESMKKDPGSHLAHSQCSHNLSNWAGLAVLVSRYILNGSQDFFHIFSIALYHKWDVKNNFAYVLQFFSLNSDGLIGVTLYTYKQVWLYKD